jgi:Rrf2 family protein
MANVLKISEAATLALHTLVFLAARPGEIHSTNRIASRLRASEAHLAKVLQRLARMGLVRSIRGARGGFVLGRPPEEISLLEAYEAIDGPLQGGNCLLGRHVCGDVGCILGGLLEDISRNVKEHLAGQRLSELTHIFAEEPPAPEPVAPSPPGETIQGVGWGSS